MTRANRHGRDLGLCLAAQLVLLVPAAQGRSEPLSAQEEVRQLLDLDGNGRLDEWEERAARDVLREEDETDRDPGGARSGRERELGARLVRDFDADRDGALDGDEVQRLDAAHVGLFEERQLRRQFDRDRDGVLDREEKAAGREERAAFALKHFDRDDDGRLDAGELDALLAGRHGRFAPKQSDASPASLFLRRFDADRDGVLDREERERGSRYFLDRFDANGDGQLGRAERKALRARFHGAQKGH